jgi:hypothetical protein
MRLSNEQIDVIGNRIVRGLAKRGYFDLDDADEIERMVQEVMTAELRVEDNLNDEVRELMREHMARIRRADVEYHEMFKVIKARLARERDIIL